MITSRFNPTRAQSQGVAPQNAAQPSFAPAPQQGQEVTVDEGSWIGSAPITYTYQWQLDGVDIAGATAKTLLVLAAMVGQALRCVVTATNQFGLSVAFTAAIVVTV